MTSEGSPVILLVGATGGMGQRVTSRLLEAGRDVRILLRQDPHTPTGHPTGKALVGAGALPVIGDLKDPASLEAAVHNVEVVLTTANAFRSSGEHGENNIDSVDRQGNRDLIIAAYEAGVQQFIFTSAFTASHESPMPFIQAKAETEDFLRSCGVPFTILAPTLFLESILPPTILQPLQAGRPVMFIKGAQRRHSFVSIEDAAVLGASVVEHPAAINRRIPIGGPEPLSWLDLVAITARVLDREVPVRSIHRGTSSPAEDSPIVELLGQIEGEDYRIENMPAIADQFGVCLTPVEVAVEELIAQENLLLS